jgi:hypothetical protein
LTQLTVKQVKSHISDGKFFRCVFVKRTDGTVRSMVCRTGVRRYLSGGELAFNPEKAELIGVFDMQKKAYRFISLDDIKELHFHGESHFFE